MNILDENIPESQRTSLRSKRIAHRQIGQDIGRKGMTDEEIISLLHQQDRPTFFTLDRPGPRRIATLLHRRGPHSGPYRKLR